MVLPYKRIAPLRIGAVPQMLRHGTVYPSQIVLSQLFLESRRSLQGHMSKVPPLRWQQKAFLDFIGRVFVMLRRSSLALSSEDHIQTNFMVIYESSY